MMNYCENQQQTKNTFIHMSLRNRIIELKKRWTSETRKRIIIIQPKAISVEKKVRDSRVRCAKPIYLPEIEYMALFLETIKIDAFMIGNNLYYFYLYDNVFYYWIDEKFPLWCNMKKKNRWYCDINYDFRLEFLQHTNFVSSSFIRSGFFI